MMNESELIAENSQLKKELEYCDGKIDSLRREIYELHERHKLETLMLHSQLHKTFEALVSATSCNPPAPIFLTKTIE